MFLLLTIFYILMSLVAIFRGSMFYELLKKTEQMSLDYETSDVLKKEQMQVDYFAQLAITIIIGTSMYFINLAYLCYAYPIDINKWPTLVVIAYAIGCLIYGFIKKKPDLTTEEGKRAKQYEIDSMKKWTLKSALKKLLWVAYYGYILWLIVGGAANV